MTRFDCSASATTTPSWCSNIDKLLSMLAPGVTSVHPRLVLTVATLLASAVRILRLKMDAGDKGRSAISKMGTRRF